MITSARPGLSALLALFAISCASNVTGDGPSANGEDDGSNVIAPDGAIEVCDEVRPIEVQETSPPDLLLVVDKSASMKQKIAGEQKWATMHSALSTTLASNADLINFGLMLYPASSSCGPGIIDAPVSAGSAAALSAVLDDVTPGGSTPTHTSLQAALSYFQGIPVNPEGRYVLLATDGEPNCATLGVSAVDSSVTAIAALSQAGIPTFVLGFGGGVNATTLDAMAQAGGQSQYYAASSPAELSAALDAITGALALPDCEFILGEVPPDPTYLRLFFDNTEVSRSGQHTDGWDYDAANNTLTIYGDSCDTLQSGSVGNLRVDYGCGGVTID